MSSPDLGSNAFNFYGDYKVPNKQAAYLTMVDLVNYFVPG